VCEAADGPVVLYDYPALSGTPLEPPLVERVAGALEAVVGIKLSGPELRVAHGIVTRVKGSRPDFAVLMGAVDLVLPGLLGGADGTIAAIANVDPRPLVTLVSAFRAGDLGAAAEAHDAVRRLLAISAIARPPILALKAAAAVAGSPIEPVVRTVPDDADAVVSRARALAAELAVSG
jgi:2-dehydro-3-deoxy-D-pentonate aldolase